MLATSDELAAVSSRSLATADSGLFGIPSSSSGFPGVASGLGNLLTWTPKQGLRHGLKQYWQAKHQVSIDGIPTHIVAKNG
jgi:hypothetical protein